MGESPSKQSPCNNVIIIVWLESSPSQGGGQGRAQRRAPGRRHLPFRGPLFPFGRGSRRFQGLWITAKSSLDIALETIISTTDFITDFITFETGFPGGSGIFLFARGAPVQRGSSRRERSFRPLGGNEGGGFRARRAAAGSRARRGRGRGSAAHVGSFLAKLFDIRVGNRDNVEVPLRELGCQADILPALSNGERLLVRLHVNDGSLQGVVEVHGADLR